jgi:excisionase family DNA binding protein
MENNAQASQAVSEFLTVTQAASYLSVGKDCVYRLCVTRKLSHYKFGEGRGSIRIKRSDLIDYVERCRIEERDEEITIPIESRRRRCTKHPVYKHVRLGPEHLCGALTAAGKSCTRMTWDERCYQHQGERAKAKA